MNFKKCISLIALCLIAYTVLLAQKVDIVKLKNGSVLKGEIVDYTDTDKVVFILTNGERLTFNNKEIKLIKKRKTNKNLEAKTSVLQNMKSKKIKKKGYYHFTQLSLLNSISERDEYDLSLGISTHNGYKFTSWLGVGVGIGAMAYDTNNPVTFPLTFEVRGNIPFENINPYYAFAIGHSLNNQDFDGGLVWSPTLGIVFSSNKKIALTLSASYIEQKASRELTDFCWFDCINVVDNEIYRRLAINVGFTF